MANVHAAIDDRYRALIQATGNIVWTNSAKGEMSGSQPDWCAYTGQSEDDVQGYGWSKAVHPDDAQPTIDAWQHAVEARAMFAFEHRVRRRDGVYRWFAIRAVPVLETDGDIREWVGVHRDIEGEKTAEIRLREALAEQIQARKDIEAARQQQEAQWRVLEAVFNEAPAPIALMRGPELVLDFVNLQCANMWSRESVSELRGKPLLEALPELRGQGFDALLRQVIATGDAFFGNEVAIGIGGKDGKVTPRLFNFVYSPIANAAGVVDGVGVFGFDVTMQVDARRDIEEARRQAEDASRSKDEFLAMLGHELRNPLAPILTALQLMRLRGLPGAERERSVIERQVKHMVRLVDDLLDVSRVTRGKVELAREPLDLADVTARAIEIASPLFEQRRHTLSAEVPRGLIVDGDGDRLAQVVSNLLTNAAKYTPVGGRIRITGDRRGQELVLCVEDSGDGIAPDLLPKVFDLFVQGRQDIDRSQGGLGIGLAIVRRLVELHDGHVTVESEGIGCGSTFCVYLPALVGERHVLTTPELAPPLSSASGSRDCRVLVVDDNQDVAELLAETLRNFGYIACVAYDGPAALGILDTFKPDIALLDIGLPVMDGYELARRFREHPALPGVRLVAITGYGQDADRRRVREAGFDGHLVKPVGTDQLLAALAPPLGGSWSSP